MANTQRIKQLLEAQDEVNLKKELAVRSEMSEYRTVCNKSL